MIESNLARRYSLGLIKAITDKNEYLIIKEELEFFLELININSELKAGLETFLFSDKQKRELLDSINEKVKFNKKTFNFLLTVVDENRMAILEKIIQLLEKLWYEKNEIEQLKVFSAVQLSKGLEKKLIESLERAFKKKIVLEKEVDKSLIAGIKIQKGSVSYDFSIAGNLRKMRDALLEEI